MNKQSSTSPGKQDAVDRQASGKHEGLRHPVDDDQQAKQRLDEVGTEDQDAGEDQLRDRRSSGEQRH